MILGFNTPLLRTFYVLPKQRPEWPHEATLSKDEKEDHSALTPGTIPLGCGRPSGPVAFCYQQPVQRGKQHSTVNSCSHFGSNPSAVVTVGLEEVNCLTLLDSGLFLYKMKVKISTSE